MAISRNEFLREFICLFHRVMPDSMVIGKGVAFNVMLPIEMPNGKDIGKSSFSGSLMYLRIWIGRWVFELVEQSSITLLLYHAKTLQVLIATS
ncbi:MAG: hypothetical protein HWN80_01585 [Candidatus Lokiarchaeota archaeon]|nr:hypothetical protein [Candidatus Lokiarchaeota archaeon]